jgi:hypothetical protein
MTQRPTVETFAEAVAEIERRFKCVSFHPNKTISIAPTGGPYMEIVSGNERPEGEWHQAMAFTEKAAAQLMLDGVLRLGEGKSTIYWRIEPEMDDTFPVFFEVSAMTDRPFPYYEERKVYRTYCRLAFE